MLAPWKKSYEKPRQCIKKQRHHFASKGQYSQSYGFSSSHVQMWELDHKEGWVPKNWCFQTTVLKKTLESLLNSKEIQLVNPKGNQPWIFIGRTDAETEAPILWPPDAKSRLTRRDPVARRDWRQEEKQVKEDEMIGWHHWLNGHEFEQTLGDSEGQESLLCCHPWGCKELGMTEQLNNNSIPWMFNKQECVGSMCSLANGLSRLGEGVSIFIKIPKNLGFSLDVPHWKRKYCFIFLKLDWPLGENRKWHCILAQLANINTFTQTGYYYLFQRWLSQILCLF